MNALKVKPVIVSLVVLAVGIAIVALVFPYYALHWGIKPCQGLPTDAANCGDGDFGGAIFLLGGAPLILYGFATLLLAGLLRLLRPQYNRERFVLWLYISLAVVILLTLALFFA
jgi:hypothetical protein